MVQDEHAAESGGKPAAECGTALFIPAQSEPMNGLRALVARGVGNKCPRGWGIAKPAVYSGLQAHIICVLTILVDHFQPCL